MKQPDKDHFEETKGQTAPKGENLTEQCEGNEKTVKTQDQEGDHSQARRR
jgi:hypothetical protein